ncbi:hypothetical protein GCM10009554_42940 [Kribbella koreensis]|uniref:Uncharacterized protein n=1 Tax=Kribbella koreensis TaxID=57909 RepID=A0ABP4BB48_9ACTN
MQTLLTPEPRHLVQVLYGEFAIAEYAAESALADRYAAAMRRRFPTLQVICTPIEIDADPGDL